MLLPNLRISTVPVKDEKEKLKNFDWEVTLASFLLLVVIYSNCADLSEIPEQKRTHGSD